MNTNALLKLLKADARLSDAQLANRLSTTIEEVAAARAELEESGCILGYRTIIDNDDEPHVSAFIEVRCTPKRGEGFNSIAERIARFDEVKDCYLISGGFDLLVLLEADTLNNVAQFVSEKLSSIDGVLSTATHFLLKTYKKDDHLLRGEQKPSRLSVAP